MGCVGSLVGNTAKSGSKQKKRFKALLNLNKLMELTLFLYNLIRVSVVPAPYGMREMYVGRAISNFLFLTQCQLFTKVTWCVVIVCIFDFILVFCSSVVCLLVSSLAMVVGERLR